MFCMKRCFLLQYIVCMKKWKTCEVTFLYHVNKNAAAGLCPVKSSSYYYDIALCSFHFHQCNDYDFAYY